MLRRLRSTGECKEGGREGGGEGGREGGREGREGEERWYMYMYIQCIQM